MSKQFLNTKFSLTFYTKCKQSEISRKIDLVLPFLHKYRFEQFDKFFFYLKCKQSEISRQIDLVFAFKALALMLTLDQKQSTSGQKTSVASFLLRIYMLHS